MQEIDLRGRFGAEVKRRRIHLGISQEKLTERAALHRTYVSDVESGKRNLSLASIQRLTEALGASLGAVFASVEAPGGPAPNGHGPGRVAEILLVEDDPGDIKLTLAAFKQAKLTNHLEVVHDGAEALDFLLCRGPWAARPAEQGPHVVLLDLGLPKINGLEVLRRLKAEPRTRQLPVVVLTASRRDQHMLEALRLGAQAYIVKPLDFQNFSQIVPQLSFRWALLEPVL